MENRNSGFSWLWGSGLAPIPTTNQPIDRGVISSHQHVGQTGAPRQTSGQLLTNGRRSSVPEILLPV